MKQILFLIFTASLILSCNSNKKQITKADPLKEEIKKDSTLPIVKA